MHCNKLQRTATNCNTLQHTVMHYYTPQLPKKLTEFLQQGLQHAATRCNTLQNTATHYNTLQLHNEIFEFSQQVPSLLRIYRALL